MSTAGDDDARGKKTQRYISFDVALKTLSVCVATVRPSAELAECPICRGFRIDIDHWATYDVPTFLGRTLKLTKCSMLTAVCLLEDFLQRIPDTSTWWKSVLRDPKTKILIETQGRFGERQRVLSYVLGAELYRQYDRKESHIEYVNATLKNTDQQNEWLDRVTIPRRPGRTSKTNNNNNNAVSFELPPVHSAPQVSTASDATNANTSDDDPSDLFGVMSNRKEQMSRNKRYAERKRAAVKAALILLKRSALSEWLTFFLRETMSKRDDYADALTQLFYFHLRQHKQVVNVRQQKKQRRDQNQSTTSTKKRKTMSKGPG